MSGFILNRGKSFASRYKEFESKPVNKTSVDVQQSQIKGCSSRSAIDCKPARCVFDEHDDIEIDHGLSRTGPVSGPGGSKLKAKGKRNAKKEKPSSKFSRRDCNINTFVLPKSETYDIDIIDDASVGSDGSTFYSDHSVDSMEPEMNMTVIDTDQLSPFKERKMETITLKLKFNGKFNKFTVAYNDRILKHSNVFYKSLGISKKTHELVITYNDKVLTCIDSAKSLNLTIVDILEAYARERSEPIEKSTKTRVHRDPNSIEIKVRNNQDGRHDQPLTLYLGKNETMRKLMNQYAETKKYNLSECIFEFDGERLSGEETPTDLDMENGSLIDVRIKKQ